MLDALHAAMDPVQVTAFQLRLTFHIILKPALFHTLAQELLSLTLNTGFIT